MSVTISGDTGITTPAETIQGNLTTTGNTILGDASTDTLNVGNGGLVKDASGNVGIGTTSPVNLLTVSNATSQDDIYGNIQTVYTGTVTSINAGYTAKNYQGTSQFMQWDVYGCRIGSRIKTNTGQGQVSFTYGNDVEAMRIDASGNLLVGATSTSGYFDSKANFYSPSVYASFSGKQGGASSAAVGTSWHTATSGDNLFHAFVTEPSIVIRGSITYNRAGGLVAYNTTSDYRAKTITGSVQNALGKVAALKPSTGRMNGAEIDIDFFVAHELQEVVPSAVTGEKDATKEEKYEISPAIPAVLDEEGNEVTPAAEAVIGTRTVPVYQMVDKSALIPLLTAAMQEQQAMIDELKAKVAALEAA